MLIAGRVLLPNIGDDANKGLGPFSFLASNTGVGLAADALANIMSNIIGVLTVVGGLWFIIQLVIGAFKWMTSGGDKNNVEQAKEHFTHAIISLGILVAAYMIAALVGVVFGLDILNPQTIIPKLGP